MRSPLAPDAKHTSEMQVANIGFLIDRMGKDAHPLQFLRELTQNSIEAIRDAREAGRGRLGRRLGRATS